MRSLYLVALALLWAAPAGAEDAPRTVASEFASICSGALRCALISDLADGVIAECEDIKVTPKDLEIRIAKLPDYIREQIRKYPVHTLDQAITDRLIAKEATDWGRKNGKSAAGEAVLSAYMSARMPEITVTDAEAREFYAEHANMLGGASFDQVKDLVIGMVRDAKTLDAQKEFRRSVGERHRIRVSSAWMRAQNEKWLQTPVEQARLLGKPTLAVFSVIGCCDRMRPVVEIMRGKYADALNVVFVNTSEDEVLSDIYGVSAIPVEIFYDSAGREVFRCKRAMTVKDVITKFEELGVKLVAGGSRE